MPAMLLVPRPRHRGQGPLLRQGMRIILSRPRSVPSCTATSSPYNARLPAGTTPAPIRGHHIEH